MCKSGSTLSPQHRDGASRIAKASGIRIKVSPRTFYRLPRRGDLGGYLQRPGEFSSIGLEVGSILMLRDTPVRLFFRPKRGVSLGLEPNSQERASIFGYTKAL